MVGPGQQRAGECCLTEDNYQLCIITCVAGHRGHARAGNWEQHGLLNDHEPYDECHEEYNKCTSVHEEHKYVL